ncbi:hypothetical protein RhiirA1_493348 [Rhizophagus irregularis]|uniref:Uncharacterized protein n=1 Tax=Rhizophagus irregularis TaxID=588596 RepID=A0A2N0R7I3_9GLOM|nr:hypothetical protein RhiirA1_493348 [Rhizophagus irregularis]
MSDVVKEFNTEELIDYLGRKNLKLDKDDIKILRKEKISDLAFLELTEEKFRSIGQIANLLYIGETLVKKDIHIYAKWGCVVNPWKLTPGRKKVFSRSDMNVLRDIVHEHVDYYLDEYIEEMQARTGKRVSVSTLWRSLAYCGITRKKV